MAIALSRPPLQNDFTAEERQWRETLQRRVISNVSTSGDANASIPSAATYHGVTALSAARSLILPSASSMQEGDSILIQDESGLAGTHTITISPDTGDTLNGTATISSNFGRLLVIKRGKGVYFSA